MVGENPDQQLFFDDTSKCFYVVYDEWVEKASAKRIALKQYTDEPGVQVYAGNFLDGTVTGKKGVVYNFRHAICLETQKYPDTPNKPDWPSATLKPGEKYTSHCVFAFSVR